MVKIYTKIVIDIFTGETVYEDSFEYTGEIAHCDKSSDSGGDQIITVRYAPYIESRHMTFLRHAAEMRYNILTGEQYPGSMVLDDSPFAEHSAIVVDDAFFGTGYTIASFPSLYDMYGKFMAGLDIDTLFSQIFEDTVNASEINDLVAAESTLLNDEITEKALPPILTGARDINSVMSSTFVIARAIPRDTQIKLVEKFSSELKYRMIPVAVDRWKTHLEWNKNIVMSYAEIMKLFFSAKMDVEDFNYSTLAKDKLWPFTVLDYERAALGALQGATTTNKDVAGGSTAQKALGGAASMAATGAMFGGLPGAVIGGVLGLAGSLF